MSILFPQKQLILKDQQFDYFSSNNINVQFYDSDNFKKKQFKKSREQQQIQISRQQKREKRYIESSPYFKQYQQKFFKSYKLPTIDFFQQNFQQLRIKYQNLQIQQSIIQIYSVSKSQKIIIYSVKIQNFELQITTLNINKIDGFNFNFGNKFSEGMFGIIYSVKYDNTDYIVKKISFKSQSQKPKQILNAIKQYAIMKIFSAFQAAPSVQSIYGFDLIINENSVFFTMQKGVQISQYFQSLQTNNFKQNIQKSFDDLRKSLLLLHSFNFTHNDIKPENIVFSPSKNKLVFIDFGLSQINPQKIGQMKLQKPKGSFQYCCQDMKKLFKQTFKLGYVDMYYNDFYGLQKSQKQFCDFYNLQQSKKYTTQQYKKITNEINFFNQKNNQQYKKIISVNLIQFIYFQRLHKIQDLIICKQQELVNILNKYFQNIYFVFFQAIYNLPLFEAYKKLKTLLIKNKYNIQISFPSRQIFQNYLDPFFENFTEEYLQLNNNHQKISNKYINLRQKIQNKKQTCKDQSFMKQTKQKQFSINFNPLKFKLNTLKSIKQCSVEVIIFLNSHSFLFQQFLELFKKINLKTLQLESIWFNIDQRIVQEYLIIFKNIYIQIQFQEVRFTKQFYSISTSGLKIVAIFQLLEQISLLFIQKFDIFKYIKEALIQKNNKFFQNRDEKDLMSNKNICQAYKKIQHNQQNLNNAIENQQEIQDAIQQLKNIRIIFFQYCIYFLSNLNKFIENHVEYQVAIKKTQQIIKNLIEIIIKITFFKSILFQQNQNYKRLYKQEHKNLQKYIYLLLDNWYKIIFYCFFKSQENYDIFKLLDFYNKLYFFEEYLEKIIRKSFPKIKIIQKIEIIDKILKYYERILIKNKNIECKIKQFHSLSINLIIFLEKYQASTIRKFMEDFIQLAKFEKKKNLEIESIKISMIWKLKYFFLNPRFKFYAKPLIQKISISQTTILSNYSCLQNYLWFLLGDCQTNNIIQYEKRQIYYKKLIKKNPQNKLQMYLNQDDFITSQTKSMLNMSLNYRDNFQSIFCFNKMRGFVNSEKDMTFQWKLIKSQKNYSFFDKSKVLAFYEIINILMVCYKSFKQQFIQLYCRKFKQQMESFQQLIHFQTKSLKKHRQIIKHIYLFLIKQESQTFSNIQRQLQTIEQLNIKSYRFNYLCLFIYYFQFESVLQGKYLQLICNDIFIKAQEKYSQDFYSLGKLQIIYLRILFKTQINDNKRLKIKSNYQNQVIKYLMYLQNIKNSQNQLKITKLIQLELQQYIKILQQLYENQIYLDFQSIKLIFSSNILSEINLKDLILIQFFHIYGLLLDKQLIKIQMSLYHIIFVKFFIKYATRQILQDQKIINLKNSILKQKDKKYLMFASFLQDYIKQLPINSNQHYAENICCFIHYYKYEFQNNYILKINSYKGLQKLQYVLKIIKNYIKLRNELLILFFNETDYNKIIKKIKFQNRYFLQKISPIIFILIVIQRLKILIFLHFLKQQNRIFNLQNQSINQLQDEINALIINQLFKINYLFKLIYYVKQYQSKLLKKFIAQQFYSLLVVFTLFIDINTQLKFLRPIMNKFQNKQIYYYYLKVLRNLQNKKVRVLYPDFFLSKNWLNCVRHQKQIQLMSNFPLQIGKPVDCLKFIQKKVKKKCLSYLQLGNRKISEKFILKIQQNLIKKLNRYFSFS